MPLRRSPVHSGWLLLALLGCGHTEPAGPVPHDPTYARAEQVQASERAPDLWARAEQARALAQEAADPDVQQDYATEARLWRQAAIAEAERIGTSEQRARAEAALDEKSAQLSALQNARENVHERAERMAAGTLALKEAQRMLELAATDRRRRPDLSPRQLREGARALIERTRLVRAAALSLGANEASLGKTDRHLKRAEAMLAKQPQTALREADFALFEAHAAFGPVRREAAAPEAAQSLADALRAAGFTVVRSERGLAAKLEGKATHVSLASPRHLQRLCKLREGFPAGAVQVTWREGQGRRAQQSFSAVRRRMRTAGCESARFDWQVVSSSGNISALEVVWLAY